MTRTATRNVPRDLRRLADSWGVLRAYTGQDGTRVQVGVDALVGVLRALGAPVERVDDAGDALLARDATRAQTLVPMVTVAWGDAAPVIDVRTTGDERVALEIETEAGTAYAITSDECRVERSVCEEVDGRASLVRSLALPRTLPHGVHTVHVRAGTRRASATLVCAPAHAANDWRARRWGVFAPVHALRTARDDAGPGDLRDLGTLAAWAARHGGAVVGTLPLLAAYLDEPYEPSPYAPVSRRYWNELYADVRALPGGDTTRPTIPAHDGLVDLRGAYAQRRAVLEAAARDADVTSYVRSDPGVERYARFRAEREAREDGATTEARARYHVYAQAVMHEQLTELTRTLDARGQALYLDFPLGCHRDGFDVWDEPGAFAPEVSVGAPPDGFFASGQDWGFPPLHPERSACGGHRYFAECVERHLRYARVLRVDHVMGLHRLWWIPPGHDPADGAYVRYPFDQLYARLCLASERYGAALVGENLGTVPPEVNRELRRHRIGGMHVAMFDVDAEAPGGIRRPPRGSLTALDTHDTATWAEFWATTDGRTRAALTRALRDEGLLRGDETDERDVLRAVLTLLARSRAAVLLVALEDLWCERDAQNVPGTVAPENWRRPAAHALDELDDVPGLVELVRAVQQARGGSR